MRNRRIHIHIENSYEEKMQNHADKDLYWFDNIYNIMHRIVGDQLKFKYEPKNKRYIPDVEWDDAKKCWRSKHSPSAKKIKVLTDNMKIINKCLSRIESIGGEINSLESDRDKSVVDIPENLIYDAESVLQSYNLNYEIDR